MAEKARLPCLIKSPVLYSHFIQSRPENVQFSPTGCNWAQRAIIAEPLCCKALQMNATQCNIMEYNKSVRLTLCGPRLSSLCQSEPKPSPERLGYRSELRRTKPKAACASQRRVAARVATRERNRRPQPEVAERDRRSIDFLACARVNRSSAYKV